MQVDLRNSPTSLGRNARNYHHAYVERDYFPNEHEMK